MISDLNRTTGLLDPGCHNCSLIEIKEKFVDEFTTSTSRKSRFRGYTEYSKYLCENIKSMRKHIIDGSFTTKKTDPLDIDFIVIIDNCDVTSEEKSFIRMERIKNVEDKRLRHRMKKGIEIGMVTISDLPPVDRFFIFRRDKDDEEYDDYLEERKYWLDCFGHTRKNKRGKRTPKGILDLTINSDTFEGI